MSKKKASTMTLKDFHGGSIPSDLPLPSAPGVTVWPSDRTGYERPIGAGTWGPAGIGRSDHHRPRPGSAGGVRGFDEAAPFLSHPSHIGRNFDEDERKPFDASSIPRRPLSVDDLVRVPRVLDVKQQVVLGRPMSNPESTAQRSYGGSAFSHSGASSASTQSPAASGGGDPAPNAWGLRKEVVGESQMHPTSTWSGPTAASRFAQASAIEKISSGRWQSKPAVYSQQPDVEVIRFPETDGGDSRVRDNHGVFVASTDPIHGEKVGGFEQRHQERVESADQRIDEGRDYVGVRSPVYPETKKKGTGNGLSFDGARPASTEGRLGGPQVYKQGSVEVFERPKLKLLPRTKPLQSSEMQVLDYKQAYQRPQVSSVNEEIANEIYGSSNLQNTGPTTLDDGNRAVERPRLNLKPRSQLLEQSAESIERERKTLFGGARPRELVLKERGIDNIVPPTLDHTIPAIRVKHENLKMDVNPERTVLTHQHSEIAENYQFDHRVGRDIERKDKAEKADTRRNNWRNDRRNGRENSRENEKMLEQRQEPDSWRKPVDQQNSTTLGPRHGKALSAVELAQAFSRSVSDVRPDSSFASQKSQSGRNQVPFSRLTDARELYSAPTPRKINGY